MQLTINQDRMQAIRINDCFDRYKGMIYKTITAFALRPEDVEDIYQDVYIKSADNIHKLKDPRCLPGWLQSITRNLCLNHLRSRKHNFCVENIEVHIADHAGLDGSNVQFAEDREDELRLTIASQHMKVILDSLENSDRKTAARLFYLENYKAREVAAMTNMSLNTTLSHLRRFRRLLNEALQTLLADDLAPAKH